ncbi:MAG: NAD(P)-dependent oxidoreductase [Candidatus Latescibacterota bacterium]|nr:NAD(P)-dependent oxidoreductase [Candidatus Latescibacterota bacterium]
MKILITGITGRIGANLATQLVQEGHSVRGFVWPRDSRVANLKELGVELVSGSLTKPSQVQEVVKGCDIIFHLGAAFQGGGPFTEEEYFEINVRGTFNVLEAARSCGIQQLVFASSDALYEKYVPGGIQSPITESMPIEPRGAYALSKGLGEDLCLGYWRSYGVPVTVCRFAMVRAADEILDFPQFYLSSLWKTYSELEDVWKDGEEEKLVVLKDSHGRVFKKHIADARDIVHGCKCVIGKEKSVGQIYQLAGPSAFTWDEAVARLAEIRSLKVIEMEVGGVPTYYEFSIEKAERELSFKPEYDIIRMIDDALSFQRGNTLGVLPHG